MGAKSIYPEVSCPGCGCELWIIGSTYIQCFVCRAKYFGKRVFVSHSVPRINHELKVMGSRNHEKQ